MKKLLLSIPLFFFTSLALAFPCYVTLVKDSCWTNYNVTLHVHSISRSKEVATLVIPEGKSWERVKFSCDPEESLSMVATFTPIFWKKDKGKSYAATRQWVLPASVTKGAKAWNINVCFAREFSEVPFPPTATGNCQCNMKKIPPI